MRVGIDLHLDPYFLIIGNLIIVNFRAIPRPRHQNPSFLILRYNIEPYMRFTLPIHPGMHTEPILPILQHIILHDLWEAILHLHSYLAVYDLVVDHVADIAEESRETCGCAVCYVVVLDGTAEGTV